MFVIKVLGLYSRLIQNQNLIRLFFAALLRIDRKIATQDKLNCIVKCSKTIFQMLKLSVHNERPISADDFFPTLVFLCIKANPPRIQSNLNFIGRFSNDNKLTMGEQGYLFANLVRISLSFSFYVKLMIFASKIISNDKLDFSSL